MTFGPRFFLVLKVSISKPSILYLMRKFFSYGSKCISDAPFCIASTIVLLINLIIGASLSSPLPIIESPSRSPSSTKSISSSAPAFICSSSFRY